MNSPDESARELLRRIPQANELADRALSADEAAGLPRKAVMDSTRRVLDDARASILAGKEGAPCTADLTADALTARVVESAVNAMKPSLRKVINATGVVLHTNLGRAPLSRTALDAAAAAASGYCNLEYRLDEGDRGSRQDHVEPLLCSLTGAQSALVVNNNAAAVLLVLAALARGREVVVSRGQLVEIGDSFRLPDIMSQSGAVLVEVGTTNRTRLSDYSDAIGPDSGLIMKIHQSNFRMVGYCEDVPLAELAELGRRHSIPVVEDLGSGSLVGLERLGDGGEHTAAQSIARGADLVTFSGDKLLGGPQAGIIAGDREYVDEVRGHPLARAVRVDKMTVAALEATLREYLDPEKAWSVIPGLRMLAEAPGVVRSRANRLKRLLDRGRADGVQYAVVPEVSRAGGGSLPTAEIPTYCLSVTGAASGAAIEERLRRGEPAVLARLKDDRLLFDLRTVSDGEVPVLAKLIAALA